MEADDDYTADQRVRVNALSESQIAAIDAAIMSSVINDWRKVAYIVGTAMAITYQPDVFVAERVRALASKGVLESRGNLLRMHYSEVRLPR